MTLQTWIVKFWTRIWTEQISEGMAFFLVKHIIQKLCSPLKIKFQFRSIRLLKAMCLRNNEKLKKEKKLLKKIKK